MAKYTFLCRNCLAEITASTDNVGSKASCTRCGLSCAVPTKEDEYIYGELLHHHGIEPVSVSQDPPEYVRQLLESFDIPVPAPDKPQPAESMRPGDPDPAAMMLNLVGTFLIVAGCVELIVGAILAMETGEPWVFFAWVAASLMTFWFGFASFVLSSIARNLFGICRKVDARYATPSPPARPPDDSEA